MVKSSDASANQKLWFDRACGNTICPPCVPSGSELFVGIGYRPAALEYRMRGAQLGSPKILVWDKSPELVAWSVGSCH